MATLSKARCARRAISIRTRCSTASFPRSAASFTPTPSLRRRGRRRAARFLASAQRMPTTFTARFPSPSRSPPKKSPQATSGSPARSLFAAFASAKLDPVAVPGVLVAGHAPFAWGKDPAEAVEHADVLEYIARLAFRSVLLGAPEAGIPEPCFGIPLPSQARPESDLRPALTLRRARSPRKICTL